MSRVAKYPVAIPEKVEVSLGQSEVTVKGPLGTLKQALSGDVVVKVEGSQVSFVAANESIQANAMSGTLRAIVANMVKGVSKGFEKKLTLVGVGYKAQAQGNKLNLALGFSHPIVHLLPEGVKAETPTQTEILQKVGQVAAEIRAYKSPEPYKGKGVRYLLGRDRGDQGNEEEVSRRRNGESDHDRQETLETAPRREDARAHPPAGSRAPHGAPDQPAHLRAGRRGRRRSHPCLGLDRREGSARAAAQRQQQGGGGARWQAHRREGEGRRRHRGGVRPRGLQLPRPREGARRRGPRRRPEVLAPAR